MSQIVVYTLNSYGNLGCFPECVIVDTDDKGQFSINFVKVTPQNKSNFNSLFDEVDEKLLKCCFQLEREYLVSKITDREVRTWDSLMAKYFEEKIKVHKPEFIYIKDYLTGLINTQQNIFFENISDKLLYFPKGKFPFTWKKINIAIEMPEMFYCFEYKQDGFIYKLDLSYKNKSLNIFNGILVSRNTARILVKNCIYEFEKEVDGSKFIPFFKKDFISVPASQSNEYIRKVLLPLIATNRVIPTGFEIQTLTDLTKTVLRIKELNSIKQTSLFDEEIDAATNSAEIVMELIFNYQDFQFWAGLGGSTSRVDLQKDSFTIMQVKRDMEMEKMIVNELSTIGLNLDAKAQKMPYFEGIEWINTHYKQIESAGIEISFVKKENKTNRLFLGERNISIELKETNDWFDIKGKVQFGKFEIPLLQVLNYIKHGKHEMLLPNGEYVQIPQVWFDEYKTLVDLCKIENGNATVSKHYCVLIDKLAQDSKVKLSVKDNMRKFLENNIETNYDLPVHFNGQLRRYQQEGFNWLRLLHEMGLGGCLADDMGLGKTIQTLCLLQWLKENKQGMTLLVVPTSLVYNWQQEAARFTPDLTLHVHVGNLRTKNVEDFGQADIVLTSYAILRRDKQLFTNQKFNYIILDEAQAIKNPQSDIAQVCLSLSAKRFLTLTGTPIENSLTDLWSQVHFFNRNMLGTSGNFTRLCKLPEKQELYRQLLKPFLLRRHKSGVLNDLPEKTIIVQPCEMSEEQYSFYKDIRNSYRDKFLENKDGNNKVNPIILLEGLLRLRQAANHPVLVDSEYNLNSGKFELVTQMLEDVISQGDKVLVFSSFVEHLKLYKNYLEERKIKYCFLDGRTKDRKEQVENFQNNDDYPVFLLSLKAGGVGLNLTRASYVFLLDPWWNPAAEAQAFDRAHRIGQQNKVFVYKFITKKSIEEKILQLQEKKLLLSDTMLENETGGFLKELDVNEVMNLIN
jgi:superfamily II DNA or RNA helicase